MSATTGPAALSAVPKRILVVCTRRIGDVLLVTPLIRSLKRAWPAAAIDAMVFSGTEGILAGNPDIASVITVGERDTATRRLATFRATWRRYDLACSTQTSDRTTLYAWAGGRTAVGLLPKGKAPAWKRAMLDAWTPFDDLGTHTVVQGLALCELLGIGKHFEVVASFGPDHEARARAEAGFAITEQPFALLHVTPRFRYKMWTVEGWRALVAWLPRRGLLPVLCAGPSESERAYAAAVADGLEGRVVNLAGRLSLPETAAIASRAALFVGTDTAVTHMAAALGTPTVALFGPSNPVKWGPWPKGCAETPSPWRMTGDQVRGNVALVQGRGDCVPCRLEGCDRHVESDSRCLRELPLGTVTGAVERLTGR